MTPKEKADHLWYIFDEIIALNSWADEKTNIKEHVLLPKKCALLLVSELIKENLRYDYIPFEGSRTEFYLQVEKELNKL